MSIDRIRIQGYRSLQDVEFAPQPLSLLVGANNAGKSNLVDAIDFLRQIYARGLSRAVEEKGGFDAIARRWASEATDTVVFDVEASFPREVVAARRRGGVRTRTGQTDAISRDQERRFVIRHTFSLRRQRRETFSEFDVTEERIEVCERTKDGCPPLLRGARRTDQDLFQIKVGADIVDADADLLLEPPSPVRRNQRSGRSIDLRGNQPDLATDIARFVSPVVDALHEELADIRTFSVDPTASRLSGAASASGEMYAEGFGLPTLVAYLRDKQPRAWDRVRHELREIVPQFDNVSVVEEYDGRLTIRFEEDTAGAPWTARQTSDGTVRALALLVAIFDPRHPLVVLEEPENSLHPWAVRVVVDACRKAAQAFGKQIILTSHSQTVVDWVRPEEIFVVWREEGRTKIAPLTELDPQAASLWAEGKGTIAQHFDSGWIRESIPGGVG